MAPQISFPRLSINLDVSLEERIQGSKTARVVGEFVSTSALFPILDAIRVIATEGKLQYLSEFPHYVLFISAFVQAWVLGTTERDDWKVKFFGNLLGLAESQRIHYAQVLRYLAGQLKRYSEWSLGSELISSAIDNPAMLQLHRVEKPSFLWIFVALRPGQSRQTQ